MPQQNLLCRLEGQDQKRGLFEAPCLVFSKQEACAGLVTPVVFLSVFFQKHCLG